MYAEEIISKIDGPIFKKQRELLHAIINSGVLAKVAVEPLQGLENLLDEIADCAHDVYGKDCLFADPELERKAEENQHVERIQTYNH
jgi:hypothetical protein